MFDKVFIVNAHSLDTATTTVLNLKFINWKTLDVAVMSECKQDIFTFNQILVFDAKDFANTLFSCSVITKLTLDIKQFVIDNFVNTLSVGQNVLEIGNLLDQGIVLSLNLVTF